MGDAQAVEKAAAEEGQARLRAFNVGIGQLCKDAGIPYDKLAKDAGVQPDALAPALVNSLAEAAAEAGDEKPGEQA